MTTIVGIQGDNFALICADSQVSDVDDSGYVTQVVTLRDGTGKVQSNGRYLIGAAGDVRAINILHHAFQPPAAPPNLKGKKLDHFFTVKFIPALRECFEHQGYAMPDNDLKTHMAEQASSIMVAVNGTIYTVEGDYSWYSDVNSMYAIGTGAQYAMGALHALQGRGRPNIQTARRVALKALASAARFDPYTGSPYHVYVQDGKKDSEIRKKAGRSKV
jgi:ATP-dependent protease HslVU (ClpYQ) peptidase subunit